MDKKFGRKRKVSNVKDVAITEMFGNLEIDYVELKSLEAFM